MGREVLNGEGASGVVWSIKFTLCINDSQMIYKQVSVSCLKRYQELFSHGLLTSKQKKDHFTGVLLKAAVCNVCTTSGIKVAKRRFFFSVLTVFMCFNNTHIKPSDA